MKEINRLFSTIMYIYKFIFESCFSFLYWLDELLSINKIAWIINMYFIWDLELLIKFDEKQC